MRIAVVVLVVGLAPVAGAQITASPNGYEGDYQGAASVQTVAVSATAVSADPNSTVVEITFLDDIPSMDLLGDPDNVVFLFDIGGLTGWGNDAVMDGLGWDVTIHALDPSWRSEAVIYFDDAVNPDGVGVHLTPAVGDNSPGTGTYSSGGIIDLGDVPIPDVPLPDGWLRVELYESWDDYADAMDAEYLTGSKLYVSVHPEPVTIMLLGLGIAGVASRRRQVRS